MTGEMTFYEYINIWQRGFLRVRKNGIWQKFMLLADTYKIV